jgi:hypothetical protein
MLAVSPEYTRMQFARSERRILVRVGLFAAHELLPCFDSFDPWPRDRTSTNPMQGMLEGRTIAILFACNHTTSDVPRSCHLLQSALSLTTYRTLQCIGSVYTSVAKIGDPERKRKLTDSK